MPQTTGGEKDILESLV